MNKFFVLAVCVLAVVATLDAAATKFTTKYDNVNLDEILSNDRLFTSYTNCILDKGKCTTDGAELKSKFKLLNTVLNLTIVLLSSTIHK